MLLGWLGFIRKNGPNKRSGFAIPRGLCAVIRDFPVFALEDALSARDIPQFAPEGGTWVSPGRQPWVKMGSFKHEPCMGDTRILNRTPCLVLKTMCHPFRAAVVAAPVPRAAALGLLMPLLQSYTPDTGPVLHSSKSKGSGLTTNAAALGCLSTRYQSRT